MNTILDKTHYWLDWLFKDRTVRGGKYVLAEAPNLPLIVFIASIIIAVVAYPGFFQTLFSLLAYVALFVWGYHEIRSGRSRFRKLLGYLGILAVAGALVLRMGF